MRRTMLRTWIGPTAFVLLALPRPTSGQEAAEARIVEALDRVSAPMLETGFRATGLELSGSLGEGRTEATEVELESGRDYALVGVCGRGCSDIDLEIYDLAGHEIDSDLEYDDNPIVSVTPERSEGFRVVIAMVSCSSDFCDYGVRSLSRPAREPDEHVQIVLRQLEGFGAEMLDQGYQRTHGLRVRALDPAESHEFLVRLKAGTTYGIAGFCDRDCADLDLAVFAEGPEPVMQDVETNDHPALDLSVTGTGVFRIRVSMAVCSNAPCVYGVALYGRPTRD